MEASFPAVLEAKWESVEAISLLGPSSPEDPRVLAHPVVPQLGLARRGTAWPLSESGSSRCKKPFRTLRAASFERRRVAVGRYPHRPLLMNISMGPLPSALGPTVAVGGAKAEACAATAA